MQSDENASELVTPYRPWAPAPGIVWALLGLVVVAVAALVGLGLTQAKAAPAALPGKLLEITAIDRPPEPLQLRGLDGAEYTLPGPTPELVVLNFWATWCPPCLEELPSLSRLAARLADDPRIAVWSAAADDTPGPVRALFSGAPVPFAVLLDPEGQTAERFGTSKFPETYVLKDGRLIAKIVGPRDWDGWYAEAYLRGLLD